VNRLSRDDFIRLVSDNLKLVRVEADYTQDRMAEILGISKKTLIQIEKGRTPAGWTVAVAFCALFRESEIIQSVLGGEPLEIVSMVAFDHYERPKEKTMGGKVWWQEIERAGDFRLQQNLVSQHYRILDKEDRRWCSSFDGDYIKKRLRELGDR
jgi:DNA-binding XRE family transcriptional regulator